MRPLLLLAMAAALTSAIPASAVPECSQTPCVYTQGANVCVHQQPSIHQWRTTCAGADGVESCTYNFDYFSCTRIPGEQ